MGLSRQCLIDIRSRLSLLSTTLRDEIGILRNGELSLPTALNNLIVEINGTFAIKIHIESAFPDLPTDPLVAVELFRIIRELLLNTAKYSQANDVLINCEYDQERIHISLSDDGVEFTHSPDDEETFNRFGLLGIGERIASLGGTYEYKRIHLKNHYAISIPL